MFNKVSIAEGVIAGFLMTMYLLILSIGDIGGPALKYGKYMFLIAIIAFAVGKLKEERSETGFLLTCIRKGFSISIISGLIVTIFNYLWYLINPEWSLTKYQLAPESLANVHIINSTVMMEIVVIGMLCSFILYQGLKYR